MPSRLCPCQNVDISRRLEQVRRLLRAPTAELLGSLGLTSDEYSLVFPAAVASIAGRERADAQAPREEFVHRVLNGIESGRPSLRVEDMTHQQGRFDFRVRGPRVPEMVIDVKGGEGNSVTLNDRPPGCDEFAVWCHLTGSLQRPPAEQTRAIIGRLVKVMVNVSEQAKRYDVLVVWDSICGSSLRPCPSAGGKVLPCIVLFPQQQPTIATPKPPVHTFETTALPRMLFEHLDWERNMWPLHTWQVEIELVRPGTEWKRRTTFRHFASGEIVGTGQASCRPLQVPVPTR